MALLFTPLVSAVCPQRDNFRHRQLHQQSSGPLSRAGSIGDVPTTGTRAHRFPIVTPCAWTSGPGVREQGAALAQEFENTLLSGQALTGRPGAASLGDMTGIVRIHRLAATGLLDLEVALPPETGCIVPHRHRPQQNDR